jgi:DASS family divalent anion:Na+ symporter
MTSPATVRSKSATSNAQSRQPVFTVSRRLLAKRVLPFVLAFGIAFSPVPAGLTAPAWHLFAIFVSAITAVLIGAFPLLTSTTIAVAAVVITGTISPVKAFAGFANTSVLLVVVAFLVAQAVVKSGLGQRISLFMVSRFGRSSVGLAYSIVLTDAAIAPAFPSNTARGGVLFPIVLSVARGSGSLPESPEGRRLGGYLMFCAMASLAVSSALWMTATSANPIAIQVAKEYGFEVGFGKWLIAACVPALVAIMALPWLVARLFPPGVGETPEAPAAARKALAELGSLSRDEWITAVAFVLMVFGWIFADRLHLNATSIAFGGLGVLLMTGVLTANDIATQGDTLATFLWLAVLFALSGQLNELGFMGYAGQRLASHMGGLPWPVTYVALIVIYVAIHYMFVSQSSQVLALLGVFLDVGIRGGVPTPLMAFSLFFASSYFSVITPQGGSQNVIFVGSGYLTQRELYRLGLLTTLFFLAVYLVIGTPWVLLVGR